MNLKVTNISKLPLLLTKLGRKEKDSAEPLTECLITCDYCFPEVMCVICIFPLSFYPNTSAGDCCGSAFLNFFPRQRLDNLGNHSQSKAVTPSASFKKLHQAKIALRWCNSVKMDPSHMKTVRDETSAALGQLRLKL